MGWLWNWAFDPWWCRDDSSVGSDLLTRNDKLISEYVVKVVDVLPTESLEKPHCVWIEVVGSFAALAKLTVSQEIVLTDMEFGAGGGESTGAVRTVPSVVMCTYLREQIGVVLQQQYKQLLLCQVLKAVSFQNLIVVRSSQSVGVFTLRPKHAVSADEVPADM